MNHGEAGACGIRAFQQAQQRIEKPDGCFFAVVFFVAGVLLLIALSFTNGDNRTLWIIGFLCVNPLTAAALGHGASWFWRRAQPDYRNWRAYSDSKARYEEWEREEVRRTVAWWLTLKGRALEYEAGVLFAQLGYEVERVGGSGDEGVDLRLKRAGEIAIVQCKGLSRPAGPHIVREVVGTIQHHRASRGILVVPAGFTQSAAQFAASNGVDLFDAHRLIELKTSISPAAR